MNPFDIGYKVGNIVDIYLKGGHKFEYLKLIADAGGHISGTYDGERIFIKTSEIVTVQG